MDNALWGAAIALLALTWKVHTMSAALDRLTADVSALTTVDASAIALLSGLADQIRANAEDPAAMNKLADDIEAQNTALSAAVTANTPVAPA